MLSVAPVLAFASGCGPRTVLVPESSPVRIGPNVKGHVYIRENGEWTLSANDVAIPEGFYLVPPSYVDE
jgi:hypothetical protein